MHGKVFKYWNILELNIGNRDKGGALVDALGESGFSGGPSQGPAEHQFPIFWHLCRQLGVASPPVGKQPRSPKT